jgi:hypothetical protein
MDALEKAVISTTMEDVRDFLSLTNETLLDKFDKNVYDKIKQLISPELCPKCGVPKNMVNICNNDNCSENGGGWC